MNSFLNKLLCCCARRVKDETDEEQNRQLLPSLEDAQIINYSSAMIDDHKAKERLNVIIRAKQGKMVNVLSRAPFNLRDETPSKQGNTSSPSRSTRSFSANHNRPAVLHDDSSRASSRKASPSITRSESASSIHHASTSQTLLEDGPSGSEPVLKARLVSANKNKQRDRGRRGRSATRQGQFGVGDAEGGDYATPTVEGVQSVDTVRPEPGASIGAVGDGGHGSGTSQNGQESDHPNVKPLSEEDDAIIRTLSDDISSTIKDGFKIQDVGTLALSWGE